MNLGHILTDLKLEDNYGSLPTWEIGNKQVRHIFLSTHSNDLFEPTRCKINSMLENHRGLGLEFS